MRRVREHPKYKNIFVSDCGQVWELYEGSQYTKKKEERYPQCKLGYIHYDKYGYSIFTPRVKNCRLNNLQDRRKLKVHQLVAQTWIPNPEEYTYVDHLDYVKTNNHIINLRWVNLALNNAGAHRRTLHTLPGTKYLALKLMLLESKSIKETSLITGVTTNTLSEAKRGTIWLCEWQEVQRLSKQS